VSETNAKVGAGAHQAIERQSKLPLASPNRMCAPLNGKGSGIWSLGAIELTNSESKGKIH